MKNLFTSIRTLCLVAVMCMVSANALAYEVYDDDGNIMAEGKVVVVEKNATVDNCGVTEGGVLIIKEGKTVTVTTNFYCNNSTIYVYGTLNIQQTTMHEIFRSTVYIMQGGQIIGSYFNVGSTINTNVNPATVGSIKKMDAQIPTADNDYAGWSDYYQRVIYSADKTDFYPLSYYYEDENGTKPIADLNAWKNTCMEKWIALIPVKEAAIAEIDAAIVGVTDETILAIATQYKTDINAAWSEESIAATKTFALAKINALVLIQTARQGIQNTEINSMIDGQVTVIVNATTMEQVTDSKLEAMTIISIFQNGKAEALGTMGEPCENCPAVEVTKGDNTIILYNPESVTFKKTE